MTNDPEPAGEGERLHALGRRRFWLIVGGLALLGAGTGLVGGLLTGVAKGSDLADRPAFAALAIGLAVLFAIVGAVASWRFFANVDELELADNLWGSLIGFYAYGLLFPLWWVLNTVGAAPEPNGLIIYAATMAAGLAGYAVRKWLYR